MNATEKFRFDELYLRHLVALKLQRKARKAIEACAFAMHRLAGHLGRYSDNLTTDELRNYFAALIDSHPWGAANRLQRRSSHG